MGAFLVRRSLQSALALFIVSLIVFVGVYGIGNPVELLVSPDATPEEVRRITGVLGLDRIRRESKQPREVPVEVR